MSMNWEDLIRGMLEDGASAEEIEEELAGDEDETFDGVQDFLDDEEDD